MSRSESPRKGDLVEIQASDGETYYGSVCAVKAGQICVVMVNGIMIGWLSIEDPQIIITPMLK